MPLTPASAARKDATMPSGNRFQHRHFATVADILKRRFTQAPIVNGGGGRPAFLFPAVDICEIFADELGATNPKFDRDRFMRACGFEP